MYKLSRVIQAHKRDARCLDYVPGVLVTGGNDKHFNLYSYNNANPSLITSVDIFDAEILSIKINKSIPNSNIFLILGCKNGDIFAFDKTGNPVMKLSHNSPVCSLDFIDQDRIVTGSWDAKGIVWSLSQQKPLVEYNEHKHGVAVYYSKANNWVVSGSQDKALNVWDYKTGAKIKRIQNAHNDIIREIAEIEDSGMIITCSNDETIKIWSADLQLIQTLTGHTAFVFSVKAIRLGLYVSGGEDRTIKVWEDDHCLQNIHLPASVWNVAYDPNGDIFAACADGFIRSFTTEQSRRAEADVEQMFNKQVLESSSKKSGMKEDEIKKLATIGQMNAFKGKKQGEIRVFRNGMVPQAYMWQQNKWVKIGDVITQGGDTAGPKAQPKYFPGDKYFQEGFYDYVFDVDDASGVPKVIPFNDGGNAMEVAQKYCKREGLTKGYLQQIRKFLMENSSRVGRKRQVSQCKQKELDLSKLKVTPSTGIIQYNGIKNPAALLNKLKEFNQRAQAKKLNQRQIVHIERIVTQLQNENTYHSWKLDFKQMDSLKKVLTWPQEFKLPVWDILRPFLKHYQSQALFSGLQAGRDIVTQLSIGLESENSQAIYTLILKTLSNILIQNTNKTGLLIHAEIVLSSLIHLSKRTNLKSANYLSTFAAFLYNFSIACIQKKVQKNQNLLMFGDLLRMRLDGDDGENRGILLQSGANILYKYRAEVGERYQFLIDYLQGDEVSSDIKMFY